MKKTVLLILIVFTTIKLNARSDSIFAASRYSFYSNELFGEIIVNIPEDNNATELYADLIYENKVLVKGAKISAGKINFIDFPLAELDVGENYLSLIIKADIGQITGMKIKLTRLIPKPNEVKIDRASGGLIVDNLPFFPFGFYCYSPVQPTLPEEEVVKGFNMISPYQKIISKTLNERKAYMDRCAELGMKVHYNLLSVAGGGGVGSGRIYDKNDRQIRNLLISEIEAFRDHPALLAWYISDEPTGHKISPEKLAENYKLIKKLDPYHPVTIVFMAPEKAREYAGVMDIVMADPYPLPHGSLLTVYNVAKNLKKEFYLEKPVWIVPQAFGGSEWWLREPTSRELRVMTYLSIINNSTGIQYFIRHGLNSFPKSTEVWAECGTISREVAELTPHLLSVERQPVVESHTPGVKASAWKNNGTITVIAVNTFNKPTDLYLQLYDKEGTGFSGAANLIFENRIITISEGEIKDMIDAYDTRIYQIHIHPVEKTGINTANMVFDPGFENNPSIGTPAYCYAKNRGDRGATYFVDSRVFYQGNHSLRLITPKKNEGMNLSFFPLNLEKNKTYEVSVWAKAGIPPDIQYKTSFLKRLFSKREIKESNMVFELALGKIYAERFKLSTVWKKYRFTARLSSNGKEILRAGPFLTLLSQGTAWFDLLEVIPIEE